MAIPKIIYQTNSSLKLPLYARLQIWNFKRRHKDFKYILYDDAMINDFIKNNFNQKIYDVYNSIQIGAAKADFFRYAILYINGGIYLDLDATIIISSLNKILTPTSNAIIATEKTKPSRVYEFFNKKKHWRHIQKEKTVYSISTDQEEVM